MTERRLYQFDLRAMLGLQFSIAVVLSASFSLHPDSVGQVLFTAVFAFLLVCAEVWTSLSVRLLCAASVLTTGLIAHLPQDLPHLSSACIVQGLVLVGFVVTFRWYGWTIVSQRQASTHSSPQPEQRLRPWSVLVISLLLGSLLLATIGTPIGTHSLLMSTHFGLISAATFWSVFETRSLWLRLSVGGGAIIAACVSAWNLTEFDDVFHMGLLFAGVLAAILLPLKLVGFQLQRASIHACDDETGEGGNR